MKHTIKYLNKTVTYLTYYYFECLKCNMIFGIECALVNGTRNIGFNYYTNKSTTYCTMNDKEYRMRELLK